MKNASNCTRWIHIDYLTAKLFLTIKKSTLFDDMSFPT